MWFVGCYLGCGVVGFFVFCGVGVGVVFVGVVDWCGCGV